MYRARVQAISGTKIFAGGKWLKCIGNKTFHVGELIWTDGRCVYGNNPIPQQPPLITAQVDEAIPIMMLSEPDNKWSLTPYLLRYYSFRKNNLRLANDFRVNSKCYDQLMINDEKGNVFVYNGEPVTIGETVSEDGEPGVIKKQLKAVNIDKRGNRFDMVGRYSIYKNGDGEDIAVDIVKNGVVMKSIDIIQMLDATWDKCEMPEQTLRVDQLEYAHIYYDIANYFIENETKWHFVISISVAKGLDDELVNDELAEKIDLGGDIIQKENHLRETFLVNSDGTYLLASYEVHLVAPESRDDHPEPWNPADFPRGTWTHPDVERAKFFLQDGYYYTMKLDYNNDVTSSDYFAPNGTKIFSRAEGSPLIRAMLSKLKNNGGYLLSLSHGTWPFFGALLRYKGDNYEILADGGCFNQRLRPMKKYKNWHKRIRELTI